jgi:DNA mismatch endonuclease (patch repair protein)
VYWKSADGDVRTYIDIAFPRQRVAVFSDGCMWHGCACRSFEPKTNGDYWKAKIARNVARDRRTDDALTQADWVVIRVWEHEDPADAVVLISAVLRRSGAH